MDWKQYEKDICSYFKNQYPDAEVTHDVDREGKYSKVERQIDILIEQYIAGNQITIVIDGKYWNQKIDVKGVESFIGMLEDIGAHKGLLISKEGFSQAALNRAHYGPSEIELDILNYKDLHSFQGHGAITYAGNYGALVAAPFGWVIDAQKTPLGLATIYQQGLDIEKAMHEMEFMYIQFWDRKSEGHTLDDLLEMQKQKYLNIDPDVTIDFLPTIKRDKTKVLMRVVNVSSNPIPEYTGFIEFESFIFFCVMFTPINKSRQNIRKLENILESTVPISVQHQKG